ncbi:alpha/beta fold hydrolase [Alkalibacillus aidingensis]|uniref:alpha/beta fold hydrolase n=1 Tax=Alkalibacillus aidingensis TaxID=2747607 RepID=UPI00166130ED|nr:alpha/beta hydrolase [Alkalibacillus aidingensis]
MEADIKLLSGDSIHICEVGTGRPTIILVHGLTGSHKQMVHYQTVLSEDYHVISYDLRGRGKSSSANSQPSIDAHVGDLIDLIMTLNLESVVLVGYSFGAYICTKVAAMCEQVLSLVLLDGAGVPDDGQLDLLSPQLNRMKKIYNSESDYFNESQQVYQWLKVQWSPMLEEATQYEVEETDFGWRHRSKSYMMMKDFRSCFDFDYQKILPNIHVPVLLVKATGRLGNGRPFYLYEAYTELEKTTRDLEVMATEANHFSLVLERQEMVNQFMINFLERKVQKALEK